MSEQIVIRGAREHNLQNLSLELPKNRLIVFTGVSGSGKSSLAFDTLYAEGQRRYIESLSAYARQFLGQLEKPDVDFLGGLSPTIAVDQKSAGHSPRSTVATITELYDYLRVLFARVGTPHCLECGHEIGSQTTDEIIEQILALPERTRVLILAPIVRGRRGEYRDELEKALQAGFARARIDGQVFELTDDIRLERQLRHDIEIVVDRLIIKPDIRSRLAESVELALEMGEGNLIVHRLDEGDQFFSKQYACPSCNISYEPPTPQMFSFNSPYGMCPTCKGLGMLTQMSPDLIVPDKSKSLNEGAVLPWGKLETLRHRHFAEALAKHYKFNLDTPWEQLTDTQQRAILYGSDGKRIAFAYRSHRGRTWRYHKEWEGVIPMEEQRYFNSPNEALRRHLSRYVSQVTCPECQGGRLRRESSGVTLNGETILSVTRMSVSEAAEFFANLKLTPRQQFIAEEVLKEVRGRLWFLSNVGLHYLTLDRTAPTLSGGEAQRIRLASQVGAGLVGVLYVLDEPSIGLHARDNQQLIHALRQLRDRGNTVLVVEHDEEAIRAADHVVDFGPGAGHLGGQIVAQGAPAQVARMADSLTGRYLSGDIEIPIPDKRREPNGHWLEIKGARHHNLKNIDVHIPLGVCTCVTGVSGSGKSSLINDILYRAASRELMGAATHPGTYDKLEGLEHLDKVIRVDQSPIGRTPRSNPATYTKLFDFIRSLYAQLPESLIRGYKPGRFSFNVKGGRCEACQGNGQKRIEMHFLADVWVTCDVCHGQRFNDETLEIRYRGKNIAEVLDMDVSEAMEHFENQPRIFRYLQTLHDVGMDYVKLGQPAPTLSGGEAQRIKLSRELVRRATGKTLYVLDEPTTGLHFADVQKLLDVLHRLVDTGNSVVVIEHNMEVIKTADYLIDLGPEGGDAGGYLVATGTPEQVVLHPDSHTGRALKPVLEHEHLTGLTTDDEKSEISSERSEETGILRHIHIRGAKEHNLKEIDVDIPHRQLVAFTGVSGSGKSSLALDTIYAEGQRRYVESLSAYARQFLGQFEKPKFEHMEGLAPAIAIEQKSPSRNPRSTVGTVTEIYDYMRVFYARVGTQHCPECGRPIGAQTSQQIINRIFELPEGSRLYVLAPIQLERGEEYADRFGQARKIGYARIWVDGEVHDLSTAPTLDRRIRHQVAILVDRLLLREDDRSRLAEAVETALVEGNGTVKVEVLADRKTTNESVSNTLHTFSEEFACNECGLSFEEITPRHFSFNHPIGWCLKCEGLGAVRHGRPCPECHGERIRPRALAVKIQGRSIMEVSRMNVRELVGFFAALTLNPRQQRIARDLLSEIRSRLQFLNDVGLHYLTLTRPAPTLSGGETQRIRLASQLGSGLTGVLYVLDEPTIGLHPRDTNMLLTALKRLRDLGNSLIVVEHDPETIEASDHILDFGPRAGVHGGQIVAQGSPDEIRQEEVSLTGAYLSRTQQVAIPPERLEGNGHAIEILGAAHNNLRDIDVQFPLGTFTCVTGVSGSGKSSLVEDILYRAAADHLHDAREKPGKHRSIQGLEHIDKLIFMDQKPIGETPRSNPATYTDLFREIRYLFAELPESKIRGYDSRRFSFNLKVGRCEACRGRGYTRVEMHFLPDVWVECEVCQGTGYSRETLEIRYKGKNIAETLKMTVDEALEHFQNVPKIRRRLQTLRDVGLEYIELGQPATTLSGGEAQRVKLAAQLARRSTGKTLYLMDEPTTGLHFDDVKKLVKVIAELVDRGNTFVVIEHNLDVIKCADHIIDLGPEGGDEGGYLVATGTPEEIAQIPTSHTGRYLKPCLK